MPKIHGKHTQVLVGPYDPSNWFNSSEQSRERDVEESTGYRPSGDAKQYVVGNTDSTLTLSGIFDGDPDRIDEIMEAQLSTDDGDVVTWSPDGLDAGRRTRMLQVDGTAYGVTSPLDGVVEVTVEFQNDGPAVIGPTLLSPNGGPAPTGLANEIGFGDLPLSTVPQDLGAAPLDDQEPTPQPIYHGAVFHVHVLRNTLDEPVDLVVEHSDDDVGGPWVEVDTVAVPAGGTLASRIVLPRGTVLERHVRVTVEAAGTAPTEGLLVASAAGARLPR